MNWLLIGAAGLGAWVLLVLLSGERQQRVEQLARQAEEASKVPPEPVYEVR